MERTQGEDIEEEDGTLVDSVLRAIEAHARGDLEARNEIMARVKLNNHAIDKNNDETSNPVLSQGQFFDSHRGAAREENQWNGNDNDGSEGDYNYSSLLQAGSGRLLRLRHLCDDQEFLPSSPKVIQQNKGSRNRQQGRGRVSPVTVSGDGKGSPSSLASSSAASEKALRRVNKIRKMQRAIRDDNDHLHPAPLRKQLHEVFKVFCKAGGSSSSHAAQDFSSLGQKSGELRLAGWLKLAKNFDLLPTLLRPHEAKSVFNEVANHSKQTVSNSTHDLLSRK